MQELIFTVDAENSEECLQAARTIIAENLSLKQILQKFAQKDLKVSSANEKEFLLKQVVRFLSILLKHSLDPHQNTIKSSPGLSLVEHDMQTEEFEKPSPEKVPDNEKILQNLYQENEELRSQYEKMKYYGEKFKEKELQNEELKQIVDDLTTKILQLEPQYMMKVYQRHSEIEQEVKERMFKELPLWQRAALKIQAMWKGKKARSNYMNLIKNHAKMLVKSKSIPDYQFMSSISQTLKKAHLTLEDCFRASDANSDGIVSCEEFTRFISKLKLSIDSYSLSKLVRILDEDLSGKLESQEFYETLAAYRIISDTSQVKGYNHQVLSSFLRILKEKAIDPVTLFNSCDTDGNGFIDIYELGNLSRNLGMKKREAMVLLDILDSDKSQQISKEEFLRHINVEIPVFKVEVSKGTESFQVGSKEVRSINNIIHLIEFSGLTLSKAFDMIQFPESGKVQISYIAGTFAKVFPNVSGDDIKFLLQSIDCSKTGYIVYKDLIVFLHTYCETSSLTAPQVYELVANSIQKQKKTIKELLTSLSYPTVLDISTFIKWTYQAFNLNEDQSITLFNDLSSYSGKVTLSDLEAHFSPSHPSSSTDLNSPRSRATQTVHQLLQILEKLNLKLSHIFKIADKFNHGSTSASEFLNALQKIVINLPNEVLTDLGSILPARITMRDLEVLIPEKEKIDVDQFGLNEEQVYWVMVLEFSMKKLGTAPEIIFRDADKDSNGTISMEEFKGALKRCIPGSMLTYTDVCMIFKAFDKDETGSINETEFISQLSNCKNSLFYPKLIERVSQGRDDYEVYKASIQATNPSQQFPIPPLPLKQIPKKKEYNDLFSQMASIIPNNMKTHEFIQQFSLRLTSIITYNTLVKVFGLSQLQASDLFSTIDLHNKGVTYCFVLCTVLDSYRGIVKDFPVPNRQSSEPHVFTVFQKCLRNIKNDPVFYSLPPLEAGIVWESLENLPIDGTDTYALKNIFPRTYYYYHFATALLNFSIGMAICPIEAMHNIIKINGIYVQACDYFERFSMHPGDLVDRSEFLDRISRIFGITIVEVDCICDRVYGNEKSCGLFSFFTFFDMILSMYNEGAIIYPLPKLPFSYEKNVIEIVKTFFAKLASFLDKPLARYGLSWTGLYTENELAQSFEQFECSKAEIQTYLCLLKMNRFQKIRCYHLISIINSYKQFADFSGLGMDLAAIKAAFHSRTSGLSFLKAKNYGLDAAILENELIQILPTVPSSYIHQLFNFIDTYGRGYIYAHQLATIIDLSFKSSDLHDFPFCGNTKIKANIKKLLSDNTRHLDIYKKTAFAFYSSCKVEPEQAIDQRTFAVLFSNELTEKEAELLFNYLDIMNEGKIRVFYYIACVESFCRNSSSLSKLIPDSPLQALYKIALDVPESASTMEYFLDMPYFKSLTKDELFRYLSQTLSVSAPSLELIYTDLMKKAKPKVYMYQFLALIDTYRSSIEDRKISKEPLSLPYKWIQKDIQTDLLLTSFAEQLDKANLGCCDYFWNKGIDPTEEISAQEFFVSVGELNAQQAAQIFKDLDIKKIGTIVLYHFMAVIESYRNAFVENFSRPVKSLKKTKKIEALPMTLTPLQDALNKLGRYIAGDNPSKRQLTGQEIFGMMDYNKDGTISMNEFLDCMSLLPLNLSINQVYLLLKQADVNSDGNIEYKEFMNFVLQFLKAPGKVDLPNVLIEKPQIRKVSGLKKPLNIEKNSLEEAIYWIKEYVEENKTSNSALEMVFARIDYDNTSVMTPEEFILALDRLRINFSPKQKERLLELIDPEHTYQIQYHNFISFIYDYNFEAPDLTSIKLHY